ncbi:MAG: hypothetical protein C0594_04010 [Marinilabiliales bacterium]|nr:MAG: hypothetical protein C0594_04010 [Marinilabiliales bacterium]
MKKVLLFTVLAFVCYISKGQNLPNVSWQEVTIKDPQQSAGFIDVKDVNSDGKPEIIMSTLMEEGSASNQATTKGAIRYFEYDNDIASPWTENMVLPTDSNLPFINAPLSFDVDEDGYKDILVLQGFLRTEGGSFQWLKGPDFNEMNAFTPETEKGNTEFFWHEAEQFDLDNDGKLDIVTTCANVMNNNDYSLAEKHIEWYRHMGNGNFERYTICDSLGGVFIKLHDLDNDGDEDIVVSQFFGPPVKASLVWLEQINAPSVNNSWQGEWIMHTIDATTGLGYYIEFYDIDADGQEELVYGNHNNLDNNELVDGNGDPIQSGIFYFEIPADPATSNQWQKTVIDENFPIDCYDFGNPESQGSPGIFSIGDVDGNWLPDIVLPGDGADNLFLLRQEPGGTFVREVLGEGRMFGMAKIIDIDGNGINEVVATMHYFPDLWQIFSPPPGKLVLYIPSYTITNTQNLTKDDALVVFPNPAEDHIRVNIPEGEEMLRIRNQLGAIVIEENCNSSQKIINLSELTSGLYFIETEHYKSRFVKK